LNNQLAQNLRAASCRNRNNTARRQRLTSSHRSTAQRAPRGAEASPEEAQGQRTAAAASTAGGDAAASW